MKLSIPLLAVAALLVASVNGDFHCGRSDGLCQNGGSCDLDTGVCACAATFTGYDCSAVMAEVDKGNCNSTSTCQNGGTCHSNGTSYTCLCPEEYIGTDCNTLRYEVTCSPDSMSLEITPFVPSFLGTIFVEGNQGKAACTFTDNGGVQRINITDINADCGNATFDSATGTSTRCFYVLFNPNTFTSRDQRICAVCGAGDTINKTIGAVNVTVIDSDLDSRTLGNTPLDSDVDMALYVNGSAVTSPLQLGDLVLINISLSADGLKRFDSIRVERCVATNTLAANNVNYKDAKFIEGSCKSTDLGLLMVNDLNGTVTGGPEVTFGFSAFKFIYGSSVDVTCAVRTCQRASACAPVNCTAGENTGYGRRKRQAEGSEDKVLRGMYTIGERQTSDTTAVQKKEETAECTMDSKMITTVVALSVGLLLVLLLCIILIVKAILSRTTVYRDDTSSSTTHLPHLPTLVSNKM
ncbi:EGF-like domain-containing protein 2 isoform X2 [Haliotis rufescens]|uniref:EGF-like domain-containing protein 2 isoform X2 n=2 Tax=Haliotis rufescens TaxID=6454 RepID=UPI00201E94D8|nr:EGF-like domain-containing protein 2 isoform X2 [Haliotis rufescens]